MRRPRQRSAAECGTRAGLYRHYKRREIACAQCLKADADYQRERYARKKAAT